MNNRFSSTEIGPYTVEYDRNDGTLRTSWPGDQIFLSVEEASELRDFLVRVLPGVNRPKIVTLCGSTRFYETFELANLAETLAGHMVFSIGANEKDTTLGITPTQKVALDELHLQKIAASDEILVLNVGGYIGKSTRHEIEYARQHGKRIRWWEESAEGSIDPVEIPRTFAQGACPKCGLDWTAHSAWIANTGDTTCEEVEEL